MEVGQCCLCLRVGDALWSGLIPFPEGYLFQLIGFDLCMGFFSLEGVFALLLEII